MAAEGEARKNNVIKGGDKENKHNKVKDNDKGGRLKFNP